MPRAKPVLSGQMKGAQSVWRQTTMPTNLEIGAAQGCTYDNDFSLRPSETPVYWQFLRWLVTLYGYAVAKKP